MSIIAQSIHNGKFYGHRQNQTCTSRSPWRWLFAFLAGRLLIKENSENDRNSA